MQQGKKQFHGFFGLGRGDVRNLLFGLALQHSEERFAKFDVVSGFFLESGSEFACRHKALCDCSSSRPKTSIFPPQKSISVGALAVSVCHRRFGSSLIEESVHVVVSDTIPITADIRHCRFDPAIRRRWHISVFRAALAA
jgi:hypothetical protein